ncbi:kinase RLK-Pelle-LRR-XI-1 family protein [Tanacetum coccineum]
MVPHLPNLSHNQFTGLIPSSLGSMVNLTYLDLSHNQFTGLIPSSLGSMVNRIYLYLDLSHNQFTGLIPSSLGSMVNRIYLYLDLSHNQFNGPIPSSLGSMVNLTYLVLSHNQFTSPIPSFLGSMVSLTYLDLSHNQFTGPIPSSLGSMFNLAHVDLRTNKLNGSIPQELSNLQNLEVLNLGDNDLGGQIPSSFGNLLLNITSEAFLTTVRTPIQKSVHHLVIILPVIVGICFLFLGYVYYYRHKATNDKIQPETIKHGDVCAVLNFDGTIAYEDFISATEDFDLKYCIGTGGYGSVYEAKLASGKTFALKKLHRFEAKRPAFDQSFKNEVQVLTNLRHKNIVKLYGFCLHNKCNFLVYEYMEKGSLFCALSDDELAVKVDWMKRVNIIKDVAHALAYMHHDCIPPIVIRDHNQATTSSNSKWKDCCRDFGASRIAGFLIHLTKQ